MVTIEKDNEEAKLNLTKDKEDLKKWIEANENKRDDVKNLNEELWISHSQSHIVSSEWNPHRKDISKENQLKMHMKKLHEVGSKRIKHEKIWYMVIYVNY